MGGGGINTSATRIEALNIQSSTAGAVIPWLRGMHRLPGNLLWYGDFKATARTQKTGGKGGGGTSTDYTYSASLLMGICHGSIHSVPTVWKGKAVTTPSGMGLTVLAGAVGQAMWSGLSGRGTQALNYSGLAAVAALNYALGDSASVENHSFEVRHTSAYGVDASTPDVDPAAATLDLLTHPHQGAAFPSGLIDDWTTWSNYCIANRLLVSPRLTSQTSARDALQTMADLTNTGIVWSDGKLKMRPYGDQAATAFGRTFTPDTTPVYQLDDSCFLKNGDEPPVRRALKSPAERRNIVKLQYRDRANGYNPAVVEAKDLTDISANGARPLDMIEADWICTGPVARFVAEIRKQRELHVLGEYTFRLPWHYALLECMDLITLSDSVLLLDNTPVRVKQIVEESDEELAITCEDYPAGVASTPLYASQGMTGFAINANVAPGNALAPVVFELPGSLTTTGLELAVATGSSDPNWGGCQVWVSYDGATYRQVAEMRQSSRYGTLQLDIGGSLAVFTNAGQQLLSGTAADAANLATLLYVTPAGSIAGEYMAYQTATLTGANAYTLGGLVRGAYGTASVEHAGATPWVRVDDAIARSGPLDPALIGKTVYIKLTSFNVFGGGQQSLADVSATSYTIKGRHYVPTGARANLVALDWWRQDAALPWPTNGEYNRLVNTSASGGADLTVPGPKGANDCLWYCKEQSGDGDSGGGWDYAPITLNPTQAYRFVVPIRRISGVANSYWGVLNVCDLNSTTLNGNPYFAVAGWGSLQSDRWYLFVGYIYPAGSTGNTNDSAGIWDCATGQKIASGNNWNFRPGDGAVSHRAYQYYASSGAEQVFGRPLVNVVDGSEPALREYFEPGAVLNSSISINPNGSLVGGGGGQVTLPGLGQSVFRVLAIGNSASTQPAGQLGLYKDGVHVSGVGRSYVLTVIDRATRNILSNNVYDVFGDAAAAAAMATALNALGSDVVIVVRSHDEPQDRRLNGGLDAAMYRCGASRAVFGSSKFRYRAAYVLIGIPGCGEGNGAEAYQGAVDSDPNAWVDVGFQLQNGSLIGVTANYQPTSLQDFGYTGDLNATRGAPAGTYVGSIAAEAVESISGAQAKANAAAAAAQAAAQAYAAAQAAAADTAARAYADGIVDAEEARAIADADAKATAARLAAEAAAAADATAKANVAATTALWTGVTGSGKPADNATRNPVYVQDGDPGAVVDGSIWITSTKSWQRSGGAWVPYVGAGSVGTGELAAQAATGVVIVSFAAISFSNIA